VAALEQRMKIEALPKSVGRAYFMLKLLRGYSTDHFSDTERQELFTDIA
jgi:hypothetical protein